MNKLIVFLLCIFSAVFVFGLAMYFLIKDNIAEITNANLSYLISAIFIGVPICTIFIVILIFGIVTDGTFKIDS